MPLRRRELALWVAAVVWLGGVAAGFAAWERYDATPGAAAAPAAEAPGTGRWSVVMFAHPHCPCTRASLTELREVLARAPAGVEARVVFVRPKGLPDGWERGELWDAAAAIPGVRVECDPGGFEAGRAGAAVSGHVVVHDPDGRVAFRGGVTKARGRTGESAGRRAVLAALRGEADSDHEAPVFGCPLFTPGSCCDEDGNLCPR
jgi:hypothetical protein